MGNSFLHKLSKEDKKILIMRNIPVMGSLPKCSLATEIGLERGAFYLDRNPKSPRRFWKEALEELISEKRINMIPGERGRELLSKASMYKYPGDDKVFDFTIDKQPKKRFKSKSYKKYKDSGIKERIMQGLVINKPISRKKLAVKLGIKKHYLFLGSTGNRKAEVWQVALNYLIKNGYVYMKPGSKGKIVKIRELEDIKTGNIIEVNTNADIQDIVPEKYEVNKIDNKEERLQKAISGLFSVIKEIVKEEYQEQLDTQELEIKKLREQLKNQESQGGLMQYLK